MQTSRHTSFKDHVASRRKRSKVTFGELIKRTQEGLSDQDKKELAELEQQLSQVEHDPYSPVTILRQMDASLRWETWVELTYGDDVNPWSKDVFVKKNFTSYAVMRALAGKGSGKISSTLQITTLLNEFKYILAQGKKEGLTIEAGLFSSFKSKCFGLIQAGLLSNEGRPKCVVGFTDTQRTIKAIISKDQHRDPVYSIQLGALILLLLYSGVRFGSIIPPAPEMAKEWQFLKWKNIKIYRCKRDTLGDRMHCMITFTHMKSKTNVIRMSDHIHRHLFSSPSSPERLKKGVFDINSFEEWYLSDLAVLPIHEDRLEEPVICMSSEGGGHTSRVSNQVWTGDAANKALQKAFRDGGAAFPVTGYCLRRNFVQALQQFGDRQQTARVIGHRPNSSVQDTAYRSSYDNIDLVQVVSDEVFQQSDGFNQYVAMLQTALSRKECRLKSEEYQREVLAQCADEIRQFAEYKQQLQHRYGAEYIVHANEEECAEYKKRNRAMINAKQRTQQKAFKTKYLRMQKEENWSLTSDANTGQISNPHAQEANDLQEANGDEQLVIVDDSEGDNIDITENDDTQERSVHDPRYKFIQELLELPQAIQGKPLYPHHGKSYHHVGWTNIISNKDDENQSTLSDASQEEVTSKEMSLLSIKRS